MTIRKSVVKRIIDFCAERNISLNKLSTPSDVWPSTLKNIMNGKRRNPKVVTIKKLCGGMELTLTDFFNRNA